MNEPEIESSTYANLERKARDTHKIIHVLWFHLFKFQKQQNLIVLFRDAFNVDETMKKQKYYYRNQGWVLPLEGKMVINGGACEVLH